MKYPVTHSGEQILTTAIKTNHKGLHWSKERDMSWKSLFRLNQSLQTPLLYAQQRYNCVFVCLWSSACITPGSQSISQPLYCALPARMVALSFLSIHFTAAFHPQTPHTEEQAALPFLLSHFHRKQNKSPQKHVITWCLWGIQNTRWWFPKWALVIRWKISS